MQIKVDMSQTRPKTCTKCGRKKDLFRHHMGNDAQLGFFNDSIKKRYYEYLDCVFLCNRCHMVIHAIYIPIVQAWSDWRPKGVLDLRLHLIKLCQMWLDGKIDNPPVTREFRSTWQRNFQQWRKENRRRRRTKDRSATS
jgi:hypothetical protein